MYYSIPQSQRFQCCIVAWDHVGGPLPVINDVKLVIKSICYMEYVSSPRGGSSERTKAHYNYGLALWLKSSHIMSQKQWEVPQLSDAQDTDVRVKVTPTRSNYMPRSLL
jgi:hypothetical protein